MLGCPRSPYSLQLGPRVLMYNLLEIDLVFILWANYFVLYSKTLAKNVFQCVYVQQPHAPDAQEDEGDNCRIPLKRKIQLYDKAGAARIR